MSLTETKVNKMLESIIKENLQQGIAITASEVLDELSDLMEEVNITDKHFDLSASKVAIREAASASKYNDAVTQIYMDLEDVYDTIVAVAQKRAINFERWKMKLIEISRKVDALRASLNGLLLLKKDTAGYFDMIENYLEDLNRVNMVDSNVSLNVDNHTATIAVDEDSKTLLNLNDLFAEDVIFNVLTRQNLLSYNVVPGSSVLNAFKDKSNSWQHQVYMGSFSEPVDVELKVKLAEEPVTINRIEFVSHSSDINSSISIQAQYSTDDYNWQDIPFFNNPQVITSSGFFDFESLDAKYIKFIMTKDGHDDVDGSNYVYEFGAKNISFFSRSYSLLSGEFISTPLSVLEEDEVTKKQFNVLACEVCEILPEGTDIEYSISTDTGTTWTGITPVNRIDAPYPKVFSVGGSTTSESGTNVKLDLVTSYSYKNTHDRLLDHTVDASVYEVPYEHIKVWRDVGQGDDVLTRGVVSGWQYNDPYYTTYINIENTSGVYIELGDTQAEIDSQVVTGTVFISGGQHKFKTHKSNWKKLETFVALDESDMRSNDPLYPYNHKMIIEGYSYDPSYVGDQIYAGVDLYASQVMEFSPLFDFSYNVKGDDYTRYSIVNESNTLSFLVKYDNNISDFGQESFYIINKNIVNSVDEVLFKAKLSTTNTDSSPIMTGYRIKIGN